MIRLTAILVLFCGGCLCGKKPGIYLVPEKALLLAKTYMECAVETNVDPETLKDLREGTVLSNVDENNLKKLIYCIYVKAGFGKKNGHLDIAESLSYFPKEVDMKQIKELLENCDKNEGKVPMETSTMIYKCVYKNFPYTILF
ncbi:pheromone/general odorant binding protein [Actinoallomurus acaciae]|uniref:Pheromone/general odorant binding protein n=1 Tax=Actinoallomurus acaciae TaxID=502577 RepID=A0ABV5Z170_9ACTN